mmetsp:Transcript_14117/g.21448  ORF Transcript_14117/g.21448 Transcript_14117/m.21448 type:complete len:179 (-) Transcript_14117:2424-2960(-)
MKEPDYTMMLMSTYGSLVRLGTVKSRSWMEGNTKCSASFQYPEVVHNHFKYRHMVDDHNAKRHSPLSLEMSWATKWWPNRVFSFLLAVTEINIYNSMSYFFSETKYPQRQCITCKKKCRTYCSCSPGTHRCYACFASHCVNAEFAIRLTGSLFSLSIALSRYTSNAMLTLFVDMIRHI